MEITTREPFIPVPGLYGTAYPFNAIETLGAAGDVVLEGVLVERRNVKSGRLPNTAAKTLKMSVMRSGTAPENLRFARKLWPEISRVALEKLIGLSNEIPLSIAAGDLTYLEHGWYVTHTGLLRLAHRKHCAGIDVRPLTNFCDPATSRWAFKATVYKSKTCRGFAGCGDADPANVSAQVRGAEMRIAETRAVNRALRKAYGIGVCSVEEIGAFVSRPRATGQIHRESKSQPTNGNGHHPLRDRLCLLIRQHQLDPTLVKTYAADYCDVTELRQASREQVATFIKHLADYAQSDPEGLLCQLNSYAPKPVCPATSVQPEDTGTSNQEKEAGAA